MTGSASVQAAPLNSLRSGNPSEHTAAAIRAILNPGATITRVACTYQYDTGFGPTGIGANFTLRVAGKPVYASPHFTDFSYDHNRSNYSRPIPIDSSALGILVPPTGTDVPSRVQFEFDNNDRNMQLLLPLKVHVECSGDVPCTPPPPPPASHALVFGAPRFVSGPEAPTGGGPFWTDIHSVSDTHALGWADSVLIGTTDAGLTWSNLTFNDSTTCPQCEPHTESAVYEHVDEPIGGFKTLGALHQTGGTASNITAWGANVSTRYSVGADGRFTRARAGGVSIVGLPNLELFGLNGGYTTLADGSMVGIAKSVLPTGSGRLSAVAYRSTDGGFAWQYASTVASAEEVPYAHEGPSEGALATLRNGTLMAVMRVEGESGHYSPYISKLSNDGGLSWHSLRSLKGGGRGDVQGAGCVRPRLMRFGGSLVLAGGRPTATSRDVVVWLNAEGDGEEWVAYSISYWHNQANTNPAWAFPPEDTNNSCTFPRLSTSYTSLLRTGNETGYILYGLGARAFTLPFRVVAQKVKVHNPPHGRVNRF